MFNDRSSQGLVKSKVLELYDFAPIEAEIDEDSMDPWDYYQKLCYSQVPPIPALTPMKRICDGTEYAANFRHFKVGTSLNIILNVLSKIKTTSELDLCDNNLDEKCAQPLLTFIQNSESLTSLNLSDNPKIRSKAMISIIDGIGTNRSLETFNISHTGCMLIGKAVATLIQNCDILQTLEIASCGLKQTGIDVAQAIPKSEKLQELDLSMNSLFVGAKRFAIQLGQNVAKSETLQVLNLSQNSLTSEQCVSLMRYLPDCHTLKTLNLSSNSIGDEAGRSIGNFLGKSMSIKHLDISANPLLNVTINLIHIANKMKEEKDKPGGNKKDKKPKEPVAGAYFVLNGCTKNCHSLRDVKMIGLVADPIDWAKRIEAVAAVNQKVQILYTSEMSASYDFQHRDEE